MRLIDRSNRHFSITEIGLRYYERCRAMEIEARAAQELIERRRPDPPVDE